jgi:1-deoxy-D-xylulose-5-phosphate synthase
MDVKLELDRRITDQQSKWIVDCISMPRDMKVLDIRQLKQLAYELQWEVLEPVSKSGGNLSSVLLSLFLYFFLQFFLFFVMATIMIVILISHTLLL